MNAMADNAPADGQGYLVAEAAALPPPTPVKPSREPPPLFRFRLRHLFLFVAAVSFLLAGLVTFQGIPAIAFLLAALVVAFHVFGNALGSKLRLHADRAASSPQTEQVPCNSRSGLCGNPPSPTTRQVIPPPWYGRGDGAVPWIPRLTVAAVIFGGCLGAVFLTLTVGDRTSAAGLAVGAVSLAAISGWFAFLGGNFYANVRRGLREALEDERKDQAPMNNSAAQAGSSSTPASSHSAGSAAVDPIFRGYSPPCP
jgi:hypothetical protein